MSVHLKCLAPRPMASMRLICIPFAGGGALAFRGWAGCLPAHVEVFAVQLPGRENRLRERAFEEWTPMMEALQEAVAPLPAQPTAIFGHSLGAVIALELARWMQAAQSCRLEHVFVSARRWPGSAATESEELGGLDDDELVLALDRRYGTLSSSLSHPDIRELTMPALRADLRLLDSYRHAGAAPLDCPLTAFAGADDPATDPTGMAAWQQETSKPFTMRTLDGAHFFIETCREELLADISRCLLPRETPADQDTRHDPGHAGVGRSRDPGMRWQGSRSHES